MALPIEVVQNSYPVRFRWRQWLTSPIGETMQECEGTLPLGATQALVELIAITNRQEKEIAELKEHLAAFSSRGVREKEEED